MNYIYRKATKHDLEQLWEKNIAVHPGDNRWLLWKDEVIGNHKVGKSATFVVLCDDEPIGEGSLLLSPTCDAIAGRLELCNNRSIANVNALRIYKSHEGQGLASQRVAIKSGFVPTWSHCFRTRFELL